MTGPSEGSILTSSGSAWTPPADVDTCCDLCCDDVGTWRDNTLFLFGGEAYKSLGDSDPPIGFQSGYMNSAGLVGTFNTGFSIGLERVRGQIGGSYGVYDFKGRDTVSQNSAEQQTFLTLGVYKRSDVCCEDRIAWGLVYDQFWAHQWGLFASELYVGQVRGLIGYATSEWNEFGVWGAFHTTTDNSVFGISPPPVRAMNQYNVYWRHNYQFGGQSMLYVGGTDPADIGSWLFGFTGQAPLSHSLALYGNFAFALPGSETGIVGSNEEEWYFGAGIMYSWGAKAVSRTVSGPRGLPLLPVANNGQLFITN
ncbi:MAG: hypothetical protein DWQ37_18355 [Planctomycetota bacterium]|nr:MAG: hypothetical protein DWQ37_18355 [Planctomycetota bacterium]